MPVETNLYENHYEEAIVEHLKELGYQHLYGPNITRTSTAYRDVFLYDVLEESLVRINRTLPRETIKEAVRIISSIDQGSLYTRNQIFFEYLVSGVPVNTFINNEQKSERVWLLDFNRLENNQFNVVNQWSYVENETKIQEALSRLLAGKTVLVIAHRMRTVENADKIIVLKDGTVEEIGKPSDLMAKNGLFAHMVELQKQSAAWRLA